MKKHGVTLIECMVCIFLLGVISIPLYYLMSDSAHKRAVIECKDFAKSEANKVIKVVENDLSQARKGTFKQVSDDVIEIKVRVKSDDSENTSLRYTYIAPELYRTINNQRVLVSKNVSEFAVTPSAEAGRVVLTLKTSAAFDGLKADEAQVYPQEKLIVMREDSSEELDPYWCDVGDQDNFFASKGSLIAGLKEDAGQLIQSFSSEWLDALGDIKSMTVGELTKVRDELLGALEDAKKSLASIDDDIMDLGADAFFKRNWLGKMSSAKKKASEKIKKTLADMKTKDSLDWEKVKACGQNVGGFCGIGSSDMKEEAIKGFYKAKVEVFNSGQEIVKQLDNLKSQASSVTDLDVSTGVDRAKWGL